MDDVIDRARALAPVLAERAQAAEEARRLPDETVDDLAKAGFLDVLVPTALGGTDLGLATLVKISRELGAACTSTGWVAALYAMHSWMLTLFPERAQREVFASRSYALSPFASAPTGMAEESECGHRLSGRWSWCSGIAHADWVLVVGLATGEDRIEPRLFLLPRADVVVHDVWHTSGMRATASNDVEVRDQFVPLHRSVPLPDLVGGADHWPLVSVLVLTGAAPVLGAAEGLLARFGERLRVRTTSYGGATQGALMSGQMRLAKATADLASARLMLDDAVALLTETYASGGRFGLAERARARLVGAHVVGLARMVVNELCAASGASVQFTHSPFQRTQRDVNTISGHLVFDLDASYAVYGKVELGIDLDPTTMI